MPLHPLEWFRYNSQMPSLRMTSPIAEDHGPVTATRGPCTPRSTTKFSGTIEASSAALVAPSRWVHLVLQVLDSTQLVDPQLFGDFSRCLAAENFCPGSRARSISSELPGAYMLCESR